MINVERFPFLVFVSMFRCSIHFEAFIFIRYYLCSLRFKTWFTWQSNSNAHNTFRFLSHLSSLCVTLNVAPNGRIVAETLLSYSFYLAFIWAFDVCDTQDNRTHFSFFSFFLLNLFATEINVPAKCTISFFYLSKPEIGWFFNLKRIDWMLRTILNLAKMF